MLAKRCEYKHEAAFLSFLPLLISDPDIERKSRRNALTSGVAASFPFASFELSDQKGIFLGLNLYNRSPVFIDLYDDYKYTNGNFAAFGNSGAGKSTLLQSIGKRLREQQRKVIYIVPEKGHEYRPCARRWAASLSSWGRPPQIVSADGHSPSESLSLRGSEWAVPSAGSPCWRRKSPGSPYGILSRSAICRRRT